MNKRKTVGFALFLFFCILLNYGGGLVAERFTLPLWLDSFGTVLAGALAGPFCGGAVGLTGCLVQSVSYDPVSAVYGLTGMALGVIVGFGARKKRLETLFGTMTVSTAAALVSVAVSVPLNLLFRGGSTGNVWGDGVITTLTEKGWPKLVSQFAGPFYLDFLDKVLTLLVLYLALRLYRWLRYGKQTAEEEEFAPEEAEVPEASKKADDADGKRASSLLAVFLLLPLLSGAFVPGRTARAEEQANYSDYVQTIYSSKNGLPCGEANDIAQTGDGILWIGTYAGLYRYNGREFRWMNEFDSVRNVNRLYVDDEGRLWIGTNDNGLSICVNEKIENVVDTSNGLPSNSVRSIIQSADGYYYIGTTSSMQILMLSGGLRVMNTLWEVNYADHIAADELGNVAAVTRDGRLFLLREGHVRSSLRLTGTDEVFTACCFDRDGLLLAGTSRNHIHIFDVSEGGFASLDEKTCEGLMNLKDLYPLEDGELFVTADNGVAHMNRDGVYQRINTNEFDNSIDNALMDYQGNLWFTSSRLGLLRMAPSAFRDVYDMAGMENRVVNAVTYWEGNYYFGTDRGLDAIDADLEKPVKNDLTDKFGNVRIRCLLTDSAGSLWICTYGNGLVEVLPDGSKYLYNSSNGSFGNRARIVRELSDGTVLAAGDTGVSFIRDHKIENTIGYADGLINSMILTVTELSDGRILAGTDGDGIAVLENRKVARMLTRQDGLSSGVILRTVEDPKSAGVFLVMSNGIGYMDEEGDIRSLDNFPYFNNYDILARDPETLFVMGSAGIYVVDRDELLSGKDSLNYELLNSRRGLNSSLTANSWNYLAPNGDLFLPCDTGVFVLNVNRYASAARSYRMNLASLRLDGVAVVPEHGSATEIGRGVSRIEMVPEVLNYTILDPYVGYRMDGFDTDWTLVPQSQMGAIAYTNLPPGEYTFRLGVFDMNQKDLLGERSFRIIKQKEIYDEPWFHAYLVIVPLIAAVWFTWYLVRRQMQRTFERQQRELELARRQIQMGNETIIAIAKTVDAKDQRTSQHSLRVSQYSVMIAKELGFSEAECENLRRAALMHDIGKIGIPDAILNKPSRLTDEEYAVMKSHTLRGGEILKGFTLLDHVVEGALYHHERFDGRGYPNGLSGEDIPLYARIIGVADAFDAMTANRVYRKQLDIDYVLNEMRKGRGTQFDPEIADILLRLIDEGKFDLEKMYAPQSDAPDAERSGA